MGGGGGGGSDTAGLLKELIAIFASVPERLIQRSSSAAVFPVKHTGKITAAQIGIWTKFHGGGDTKWHVWRGGERGNKSNH